MSDKPLPAHLAGFVGHCVGVARTILEDRHQLSPMAFIGQSANGGCVILPFGHLENTKAATMAIRIAAELGHADYVLVVMEAYTLEGNDAAEMRAIMQRYGSLSKAPQAIEVVTFLLETSGGTWAAVAKQQTREGGSKTFGDVAFEMTTRIEGRFSGLLPAPAERN